MMDAPLKKPELRVAPLARDTLHERAYRRICDLILDGEIAPGQVVTIQNLAEAFGVSTMPVREALKRLTAAGAISLVTGRSMGIPRLSLERLADLRRVRLSVEGIATEWAAELMEPGELARLRRQCTLLSRAAKQENVKDYLRANRAFHFTIYNAARSPTLVALIEDAVASDRAVLKSAARIGKLHRIQRDASCDPRGVGRARRKSGGKSLARRHQRRLRDPLQDAALKYQAGRGASCDIRPRSVGQPKQNAAIDDDLRSGNIARCR